MVFLVTGVDTSTPACSTGRSRRVSPPGCMFTACRRRRSTCLRATASGVGEKTIRATPGTFLFIPPGTPHNITNVGDKPARVLMTVSPPGHEGYFVELAKLAAHGAPDPKALAALRDRYDTDQLSTLTTRA